MDPLELLDLGAFPDRPLVLTRDGTFSRAAILSQGAAMARRLEGCGARGTRVILSQDSGPDFVASLVGCWMAGATPVLLDPLVRRELGRAAAETKARAVIRGPSAPGEDLFGLTVLAPDRSVQAPCPAPHIPDDAPLVWLFTSGSTGEPALVPKTFGQLDVEVRFLSTLFPRALRVATLVPWCHILGFIVSFLLPVHRGGLCDLRAGISPRAALDLASKGEIDLVVAVPSILRVMIRCLAEEGPRPRPAPCDFAVSGAPLAGDLRVRFEALTGRTITDLYGSTEAGGVAFRRDDGPWLADSYVEWRIAGDGRLEVRSPAVSVGVPGAFYAPGDLAAVDGAGFRLAGRADDVVKIGGRRIALGEVEQAVEACPGVALAAVLARVVRGETRLAAFVVPEDPGFDPETVKAFVRKRLADHKVPRLVTVVDALPRTPAGKVDRRALERGLEGG
ncbi:MAG: class I adenylate-forming enzyme family protein [Deltaproteobacteria bacterium]|nr:class I adenylate-forming enzyme family protein [Deltaproteobacteria bacterium]